MYFISYLTCFFLGVLFASAFNDTDLPDRLKAIQNYGVYYTLNATLADFKSYYHIPFVNELLREVQERFRDIGQVDTTGKNHPFIAVEGVHRKTRNIVGIWVARKLGADVVYSPPDFMVHLAANITDTNLRKAFFGLTNYVAACTARHLTRTLPAVVCGHWMNQVAFAIAKVFDIVPQPESRVFSWPLDLYPPDIVFFVNSKQRKGRRRDTADPEFLSKFIQVYRNWRKPPVFEISNTYQYEAMANKIIAIINREFQLHY